MVLKLKFCHHLFEKKKHIICMIYVFENKI